ncbi:urea ABC transporter permease UrtB [Nitratireductor indicus C115]|uniref:Urea ABC transporter permease UrtB n=1 Tax=Nitratireductor indicus C115 TaxID=1231190 RepID=K2P6X1_9HYPH|nr:urea ABC transporter permease subunit UrtB [Nitratireductor indicus]EKF43011.1 urea ABC transporter permease UrtB [Nitratireductor indicus C115]SFQ51976.1 urea transport system permease protein [Nitratireductor indicus]
MSVIRLVISMIATLLLLAATAPSMAQTDPLQTLVQALPKGGYAEREKVILDLAGTGDPRVADVLGALGKGDLYTLKDSGTVIVATGRGNSLETADPLTGKALGAVDKSGLDKIRVNNRLRRAIDSAVGQLTLMGKDPATRLAAAQSMLKTTDPAAIGMLDTAIAQEDDARVKTAMEQARAAALLKSDAALENKIAAIDTLIAKGDREALAFLTGARSGASADLLPAIESGIKSIEDKLAFWSALQNVWYGLSLGSVLLLAAIGLAITFGVMGVINMAHGEIVMLGAYTTFVVQEVIRNNFPGLFDYSLAIALPLAFLVTGAVGVAIERGIIRWLYGRPLETLLATWGLSLILQQTVRTIFGPNNREVGNPSWMSGAFDLWGLSITWNRLWIVIFAMIVFAVLLAVLNRTPLGLQMRAVTQNRRMASSMGIRTPWVDALTFGLGSGIAGIAGVALSQIDNVSPNLGQSYIIDSFMVVVFGGVGNLWGTLVGALTLGIANKFLEPYAGAVLGKILILVFIILFIQRRPRGLFALKGRAVDA